MGDHGRFLFEHFRQIRTFRLLIGPRVAREAVGAVLGHLGRSRGGLGGSWGISGRSWGGPGRSWSDLGRHLAARLFFVNCWLGLRTAWEGQKGCQNDPKTTPKRTKIYIMIFNIEKVPPEDRLGAVVGHLLPILDHLGRAWGHLGAIGDGRGVMFVDLP